MQGAGWIDLVLRGGRFGGGVGAEGVAGGGEAVLGERQRVREQHGHLHRVSIQNCLAMKFTTRIL